MNARKTFSESTHAKPFSEMVISAPMAAALDYAMLALMEDLQSKVIPDGHSLIRGAQQFREILETIYQPQSDKPKDILKNNLDYAIYERTKRNH